MAYAEGAGADTRCYRVKCDKLPQTVPEFQPQWDARRGAEQLYAKFKEVGLTLEEFEGATYKRVSHVKKLLAEGILDGNLRRHESAGRVPPARQPEYAQLGAAS